MFSGILSCENISLRNIVGTKVFGDDSIGQQKMTFYLIFQRALGFR